MKHSADPIEVLAMKNQRKFRPLNWQQKRIVAVALQSEAATVCELSEWSGLDALTILSIGAAPEFSDAGILK